MTNYFISSNSRYLGSRRSIDFYLEVIYVSHNVMTHVKIYFHRHHRECVNLPTVPVKIPPIVHIARP